jgi:NADH-quinone oxidoreductase E subunit
MENLQDLLKKYPNLNRDSLIPILQDIQDQEGYISEDSLNKVSSHLGLPSSKVYGLATFYNQFRFSPPGKYHIQICNGTSCHIKSSEMLIREIKKTLQIGDGEISRDGIFSLEVLSCIGACGQSPVISINGEYYEKVNNLRLKEIINFYKDLEDRK